MTGLLCWRHTEDGALERHWALFNAGATAIYLDYLGDAEHFQFVTFNSTRGPHRYLAVIKEPNRSVGIPRQYRLNLCVGDLLEVTDCTDEGTPRYLLDKETNTVSVSLSEPEQETMSRFQQTAAACMRRFRDLLTVEKQDGKGTEQGSDSGNHPPQNS